jgi:hypothetical protein
LPSSKPFKADEEVDGPSRWTSSLSLLANSDVLAAMENGFQLWNFCVAQSAEAAVESGLWYGVGSFLDAKRAGARRVTCSFR